VWGIILMLHAVTTSFSGFFALRFLLGTFAPASLLTSLIVRRQECANVV
jgi:hypothetical protein